MVMELQNLYTEVDVLYMIRYSYAEAHRRRIVQTKLGSDTTRILYVVNEEQLLDNNKDHASMRAIDS